MPSFSERHGYNVRPGIQRENLDKAVRHRLWNVLRAALAARCRYATISDFVSDHPNLTALLHSLWDETLKLPHDSIPQLAEIAAGELRGRVIEGPWHLVFDIMEHFVRKSPDPQVLTKMFDDILSAEATAYRFLDTQIVEVTSAAELAEIEAAASADGSALDGVRLHLRSALGHFGNRENPDYRNTIKESILAVEALCNIIAGSKATLGDALRKLAPEVDLHPALKKALSSLYGYTSDGDGIRHAMLDAPSVGSEDARFMLVTCSSFVNFLIEKGKQAGVNLE